MNDTESHDRVTRATGPWTVREMLRLAAALEPYGLPYVGEVWVAMNPDEPMDVLGVAQTLADCERLIATAGRAGTHLAYGPIMAPEISKTKNFDIDHPSAHNWSDLQAPNAGGPIGSRNHAELTSVTLVLEWTPKTTATGESLPTKRTYSFDPHTDAIFITRAAREAFAYPRYLTMFGQERVDAIRGSLGDTP